MANKTFPYAVIIDGEIVSAGTPIKSKGKGRDKEKAPDTSSEAGAKNDECADAPEGSEAGEEAKSKKAGAENDDTGTDKKS